MFNKLQNLTTYALDKLKKAFNYVAPGIKPLIKGIKTGDYTEYKESLKKSPIVQAANPKGKTLEQRVEEQVHIVGGLTGTVQRKFVTSVQKKLPQLHKVAGQYIPRSTDDLAIKAKNLIKSNLDEAEKLARKTDDRGIATASELIKKYAADADNAKNLLTKNALYDKAAELANSTARNLTELGRSVQAASILGKLTPEGQVRFAAREIQRFNEEIIKKPSLFKKAIPQLTGEQTKQITNTMKVIQVMPEGIGKVRAFRTLQDQITDLVPTPLYQKLTQVWKAGLLTGVKTSGLNVGSNLFHGGAETIKDIPAVAVDKVSSLFTGKRTLVLTGKGGAGGIKEGFEKGYQYLKTGIDVENIGVKVDYNRISFGKGKVAKAAQAYTNSIFRLIGAEDQPFFYGAKARSIASQAIAKGKNSGFKGGELKAFVDNLIQNPTDDMARYATIDGEIAVFRNTTFLGNVAKLFQKIPVVGQIIVPFSRTPAAVATQLINYSPIGIVKTIAEQILRGKFDQRLFSQGLGRGLTGTGVFYLGGKLFEKGMITLGFPTTESEQKQWQLEGKTANSIRIGDKWRSVNVLGPAGNVLVSGGYFKRGEKETGSFWGGLAQATTGGLKSLTEQTFLRGVNQLVDAINDPQRSAQGYFTGLLGSIIPTIVSDVARGIDKTERRTEGFLDPLKSRIPGIRGKLEPKVNTLGGEIQTPDFLTVMADPTRPSVVSNDPLVMELGRLQETGFGATPTQLGDKKGYKELTPEQNTRLWKRSGMILQGKLNNLIQTEEYREANDEAKQKIIKAFTEKAKVVARVEVVIERTEGLQGEELKAELSRLKKAGLLTMDVFKMYAELR